MSWDMDFITEEQFREHVKNTIKKYGEKLEPYDGDNYSLDDEIIGLKLDSQYLTVWYESEKEANDG